MPTQGRDASTWAHCLWALVRDTARECWDDRISRLAAALAYYAVFAVAPLLVICVKVAGLFFGQDRSRREAHKRLRQLLGDAPAHAVQDLLDHAAAAHATGTWSAIAGGILLVYVATTLFGELQDAMNTIWEVQAGPDRTWTQRLTDRLWPFLMVMATGAVLLVCTALGPVLTAVGTAVGPVGGGAAWVHHGLRIAVSVVAFAVAFTAVYKVLPDVTIRWGDAAVGAAVTAVLFTAGELLLQRYFNRPGLLSVYGTAGSVAVVLLWVYYSAHVLFVGAEFTQVYARQFGHELTPTRGAVRVPKQRHRRRA